MTLDIFSGNAPTESNRIGLGGERRGSAGRVRPDVTTSSEDSFSISACTCECAEMHVHLGRSAIMATWRSGGGRC